MTSCCYDRCTSSTNSFHLCAKVLCDYYRRAVREKVIFSEASIKNSVHRGWYPSMPCRYPEGSPGPHLGGSTGPNPRGLQVISRGGCVSQHEAEADPYMDSYCHRQFTSHWNAFLFLITSSQWSLNRSKAQSYPNLRMMMVQSEQI